ncbi:MAG: hypothetical protein M3P13_07225 [Acidobacteriota bacterium]|nr:hypothetical protein [Acidobacteriota bacterium]
MPTMPTLTSPIGIKDVAAGRGIQQRIAKAIAAAAVRMFICLWFGAAAETRAACISLCANYLPVKEKGLKPAHAFRPKLTPGKVSVIVTNVLTLSLPGQSYRFRRGTFSSYWWWHARAEEAIH